MPSVTIQRIAKDSYIPKNSLLQRWAKITLPSSKKVTTNLRIVNVAEMTALNERYRKKNGATNVLAFPFTRPPGVKLKINILGDVVLCAAVINQEAEVQHKSPDQHWAHMVIHGMLHLQGYDHVEEVAAAEMESLEIKLLQQLGFANPYQVREGKFYE